MSDGSYSGFDTLEREEKFRNPPKNGHSVPILNEFVTPHIESFNALFDDSGLPAGDGDGKGLLSLAIQDIDPRVVFDYTGPEGANGNRGLGNRMSSMCSLIGAIEIQRRTEIYTNDSLDSAGSHCSTPSDRQAKKIRFEAREGICVSLRGESVTRWTLFSRLNVS